MAGFDSLPCRHRKSEKAMRRYFQSLVLLGTMATAAVCCDRRSLLDTERTPLEFAVGVETKSVVYGGSLPASYALCMSAHLSDSRVSSNDMDYFTAHTFVHENGTWKGSPEIYWPLSGRLDFLCLAAEPSGPDLASLCRWAEGNASKGVIADIPDGTAVGTEVLYAAASAPQAGSATPHLTMKHSQCLQRFTFTSNASNLIRIDGIVIDSPYTGGRLTVLNDAFLTASWDFEGHSPHHNYTVPGSVSMVLGMQPRTVDVLLPQQEASRIVIHYRRRDTISTGWNEASLQSTVVYVPKTGTWLAGKCYEYAIQAKLDEFIVSVSITPWGPALSQVSTLL